MHVDMSSTYSLKYKQICLGHITTLLKCQWTPQVILKAFGRINDFHEKVHFRKCSSYCRSLEANDSQNSRITGLFLLMASKEQASVKVKQTKDLEETETIINIRKLALPP
jgi:hypothetical protein